MASPGNKHCANCIGTHSFHISTGMMSKREYKHILADQWVSLGPDRPHWRLPSLNTRSSATADGPRDALCQSKPCQLLHNWL